MDQKIKNLVKAETKRQQEQLTLIASENYIWPEAQSYLASSLTNKYSEGYAGKRYYPGNQIIDEIEQLAIERAKKLFGVEHVNVQALSGAQANLIIYSALLAAGDTVMSLALDQGGHLSHGHSASWTSKLYKFEHYQLNAQGSIDMMALAKQAKAVKPKLIVAGFSAYSREIDWASFAKIAKSVGAYLVADISHTAGLIVGKAMKSPAEHADVIMTTTHKSLRGPRGALIMCRKELAQRIDQAVFPGLQGGPHDNVIASIATTLALDTGKTWQNYAKSVVKNAQSLAKALQKLDYEIVSGGTDSHLMIIDLTKQKISGKEAETRLAEIGILVSRSTIPHDPRPPYNPSGIRLGTAAVSTRGLGVKEMQQLASVIDRALKNQTKAKLRNEIKALAKKFPVQLA
jgi:glycine hydroxymethyltransferase